MQKKTPPKKKDTRLYGSDIPPALVRRKQLVPMGYKPKRGKMT